MNSLLGLPQLTWPCRVNRHFQLITRIFHGLMDLLVFQIHLMNTSQLSYIVELGLFSSAQYCSSFGFDFLDIPDQISGRTFSGLNVA